MPIRKEMQDRYPKDWKTVVVPRIRARSCGQCECTGQCGIVHLGLVGGRCQAFDFFEHPTTGSIVVLTVMHLNHLPEDCRDENLLHGCQQCHNRYDAPMRRRGILDRARRALGMKDFFEESQT